MKDSIHFLVGAVCGAALIMLVSIMVRSCSAAELGIGIIYDGDSIAATARLSGDFAEWGIKVGDRVRSQLTVLTGEPKSGRIRAGVGVVLGDWEPVITVRATGRHGYIAIESTSTQTWGAAVYQHTHSHAEYTPALPETCPPPHKHPPPCI